MEITANTMIIDLLREYPEMMAILAQHGIADFSCPMERYQRLCDIARSRGIMLEELIDDLRRAVEGQVR